MEIKDYTDWKSLLHWWEHQVSLFLSFNSYLLVAMMWNNRLATAQAGRILLNRQHIVHPWDMRLGWPQRKQADPKEWPPSLLAFLFHTFCHLPLEPDWSSLMLNRACTSHQSGKGMQIDIHFSLWFLTSSFLGFFFCLPSMWFFQTPAWTPFSNYLTGTCVNVARTRIQSALC